MPRKKGKGKGRGKSSEQAAEGREQEALQQQAEHASRGRGPHGGASSRDIPSPPSTGREQAAEEGRQQVEYVSRGRGPRSGASSCDIPSPPSTGREQAAEGGRQQVEYASRRGDFPPPGAIPSTHSGGRPSAKLYKPPPMKEVPQEPPKKSDDHKLKESKVSDAGLSQPSVSGQVALLEKEIAGLSFETKPSKSKFQMAKRPGRGKLGRKIDLIANYFQLRFSSDIRIYHYDVDIVFVRTRRKADGDEGKKKGKLEAAAGDADVQLRRGESLQTQGGTKKDAIQKGKITHLEHEVKRAPGKQRCRKVIAEMVLKKAYKKYNPVYDGQKNIYTTSSLPISKKETYIVTLDEDARYTDFEVVIQPVVKIATGDNVISLEPLCEVLRGRSREIPQEVLMAFDTIMCHRNFPSDQVQVGRSFFLLDQRPNSLGEGLEIWFGYNQSVRLTERGPAVIVNYSAKAFHKSGSVINYASDILRTDITKLNMLNPRDIHALSDALSKLKIQVTHLKYPRKYPVKSVAKLSARDQVIKIKDDNGRERSVTVEKYFLEAHKYRLKYPYLPCLHMRSNTNNTFIPMEVCVVVPNQPKLGKLSGDMTAKMIKETAIEPARRFSHISEEVQTLNRESGQTMKDFGLRMELEPMRLPGRVLGPPSLTYASSSVAKPDMRGTWRMDGKQFFKPPQRDCTWMLFNFSSRTRRETLERLANTLSQSARNFGMRLENVRDIRMFGPRDTEEQALKYAQDSGVTFVVIVLSPNDQYHSYEEIKFKADIKFRVITQCIKESVAYKFNPQVATNILLKINSKLGGVNHALLQSPPFFRRPIIVFGADAIHSPRGFPCPSIAALVGSLDAYPSKYAVTCRVQYNPDDKKISQEIILDLEGMVEQILKVFKNNTRGKYPERIIFFRDGVSEGQFSQTLEIEIPQIQKACNKALDGNIPPITYIVVQKRHQTRFRPQNPRDGVGKMGNVPPGTTVDTDITHPIFFDFFICSHEGIQGTSKPAHYTVIFDENNFSADDLQMLCYHLCHMYARCNRSISIPPPVMYADLACTRAKKYAELHIPADRRSTSSSGSTGECKLPEDVENAISSSMLTFDQGMFFI